jgi:hypothetical protein
LIKCFPSGELVRSNQFLIGLNKSISNKFKLSKSKPFQETLEEGELVVKGTILFEVSKLTPASKFF